MKYIYTKYLHFLDKIWPMHCECTYSMLTWNALGFERQLEYSSKLFFWNLCFINLLMNLWAVCTYCSCFSCVSGSKSPGFGSRSAGPQQGSGGDGERWGADGSVTDNLNEQIICALARLQDDMQSVLERLHTLEALTASQVTNRHFSHSTTYNTV